MIRGALVCFRLPRLVSLCAQSIALLMLGALIAMTACGGSATTAKTAKSTSKAKAPPGVPTHGDEGWCDPMPKLGDTCTTELKECTIVCDYISDNCATLVCLGNLWEYVERGGGAKEEE